MEFHLRLGGCGVIQGGLSLRAYSMVEYLANFLTNMAVKEF